MTALKDFDFNFEENNGVRRKEGKGQVRKRFNIK